MNPNEQELPSDIQDRPDTEKVLGCCVQSSSLVHVRQLRPHHRASAILPTSRWALTLQLLSECRPLEGSMQQAFVKINLHGFI